jgi:hypothetical protein
MFSDPLGPWFPCEAETLCCCDTTSRSSMAEESMWYNGRYCPFHSKITE